MRKRNAMERLAKYGSPYLQNDGSWYFLRRSYTHDTTHGPFASRELAEARIKHFKLQTSLPVEEITRKGV